MNTTKKATLLAAIIGLALTLSACDGMKLPKGDFGQAVGSWQNSAQEYLVDNSFLKMIGEVEAAPFLVDIDGNNTLDLVVGDAFGYIEVMVNGSYDGMEIVDSYMLANADGPIYFCDNAAPAVYQIDGDGDWEMLVGCGDGSILYVDFHDLTPGAVEFWVGPVAADGAEIVAPSGYATPTAAYVDGLEDDLRDLVVGAGDGSISYYRNVGADGAPQIQLDSVGFDFGDRAAVTAWDIDGDFIDDYIIGNQAGEVWACSGVAATCALVMQTEGLAKPTVEDFNHDGFPDLVIGTANGSIFTVTANPLP